MPRSDVVAPRDAVRSALRAATPRARRVTLLLVALILISPGVVGLLHLSPSHLRWGMYSHLSDGDVEYVGVLDDGSQIDLSLDGVDAWTRGDHIDSDLPLRLCEDPALARVERVVVGVDEPEVVECP